MSASDALQALDIRVGRILRAEPHPAARKPSYQLWVDFGTLGIKPSSAQLTDIYRPADVTGRLIVAAVNLGPRKIVGFTSDVLVLGVPDEENRVVLLTVEREVPLGGRVY